MAKKQFNELPTEVQEEVKLVLGMYDEVHVTYEDENYKVSANLMLTNKYAEDYQFLGTYKATEVLTKEEHIRLQILTFGYSPTYGINFYPNKKAWSPEAIKYEAIRNEYIQNSIEDYKALFHEYPSQDWIERL